MKVKRKKVAIIGGHYTPALAVEEFFRSKNWETFWIGLKRTSYLLKTESLEKKTVEKKGIKSYFLEPSKLSRNFCGEDLFPSVRYLLNIPINFFKILFILMKEKPDAVLCFGGPLGPASALPSFLLNVPFFTHEQTTTFSLSNKISGLFSRKVFVSFQSSIEESPKILRKKIVLTGNPLTSEILSAKKVDLNKEFGLRNNLPVIFVTGGNQGSHQITENVFQILDQLILNTNIIHQVGNWKDDLRIAKELEKRFPDSYFATDFFDRENQAKVLKNSDLVISRSGANIVSEIIFLKKKCILVPLLSAKGIEQLKNAREVEKLGLGMLTQRFTVNDILTALDGSSNLSIDSDGFSSENYQEINLPQWRIFNKVSEFLNSEKK